jgi:transcription elongation GreA/GreB family factor
VFSRLTIDFEGKPGHSMDLGFAVQSLQPIPKVHILAKKYADLEGLRQLAALNHLDLIKIVLHSHGERATIAQIQKDLVPEVIADDWKKWWEVARKEMKKDGHFVIPLKKTEPIVYNDEVVSLQDRLMKDFSAAKGLKARVAITIEMFKSLEDLEAPKVAAEQVMIALSAEVQAHLTNQPGVALEAIFARDDLATGSETEIAEGAPREINVWEQASVTLGKVLDSVPAVKHRRTLGSFKNAHPETWIEGVLAVVNSVSAKLCGEVGNLLGNDGHFEQWRTFVSKQVNQHQASSEMLLWLAKERSDAYADVVGPEVFRAMLTAIERDQFNEKRSNRLADFIMGDKELVTDLFESADIEIIKDIVRALKLSASFDDMDTRSILARIVKQYPAIQSMISGDQKRQEDIGLVVSWTSLERRRLEYEDIVRKKIPANSKEIAIARSYGDLRENHEYKSAKEHQKLLMTRKAELEHDLTRARGTNFENVNTDTVGIGVVVKAVELNDKRDESFSILGAWDSDPDRGIISYETPLAKAMLNHKPGEEVVFVSGDQERRYRIDSIGVADVSEFVVSKVLGNSEGNSAEGASEADDAAAAE